MRYVVPVVAIVALLTTCFLARLVLSDRQLYAQHGWDARLYCQAATIDRAGLNPYLSHDFPFQLPWLYPPGLLNVFRGLCAGPIDFARSYPVVYLGLALGCVPLWRPGRDWLLGAALTGALSGLSWTLLTGNLDMILLVPVSLSFYALGRARWNAAAAWLGVTAAVKIVPLVYLPLILLAPTSWRNRWRALGGGLLVFALVGGILTVARPELTAWFFRQLLGTIPDQQGPATEFGGVLNPAFPYLAATLSGWPNDLSAILPGILMSAGLVAIAAIVVVRFVLPADVPEERFRIIFALAFLGVHLLLPRLKPYSFILLTPALFWAARRQSHLAQSAVLIVGSLYPAWATYVFLHRTVQTPLPVAIEYSQSIALVAALTVVLVGHVSFLMPREARQ